MARIQLINLDGVEDLGVNVSQMVGFAGPNLKDDVMLIQALFNYIARFNRIYGVHTLFTDDDTKIPEITGVMDNDTYTAIGEFQIANATRLLMPMFDGRIHPGNYKGRVIKSKGGQRLMSITLLHILAKQAASFLADIDYTEGLAGLNYDVAHVIDMAVIAQ